MYWRLKNFHTVNLVQSCCIFLVIFATDLIQCRRLHNRILSSPMVTDWGTWGNWDRCPFGTFVIGMQLKVESRQQFIRDDTGLNGIRLICSSILSTITGVSSSESESENNYIETKIESLVGPWGSWRSIYYCDNGIVTGFQLRSEFPQGSKNDDTAANNFRIICSDGNIIEGEGTLWGVWTSPQMCPRRTAICSMQTQVEMKRGFGTHILGKDNTALNNIRAECCEIPNPAQNCTPSDHWELISECDNINGFTPTTCTYERKIGIGYGLNDKLSPFYSFGSPNDNNLEKTILEDAGYSLGLEATVLAQKFQDETGFSSRTGYPWSSASTKSNSLSQETSAKISFDVPPGVKTQITQVVGTCGPYLIRTAKFQRVDSIESPSPLNLNETTTRRSTAY